MENTIMCLGIFCDLEQSFCEQHKLVARESKTSGQEFS